MSTTTPTRPQEQLGKVADEAVGVLLTVVRALTAALARIDRALQNSRPPSPSPIDPRPTASMSEWTPALDAESDAILKDLAPATNRALSASLGHQ